MKPFVYLASHYPYVSHRFMLLEVRALRRLGWDVKVVSVNGSDIAAGTLTDEEAEEQAATFYLKRAAWRAGLKPHARLLRQPGRYLSALTLALRMGGTDLGRLWQHLYYFHEALVLVEQMERWNTPHVHTQFAMAAAAVGTLAGRLGASTSIAVHGPDDFYDVRFYRLVDKFLATRFMTAIGWYARSQVCRLLPPQRWSDVVVTPLGVDLDRFQPGIGDRQAGASFRLLCVGRLVAAKGQRILLDALAQLRQTGRDVHLTLVGDGPERGPLLEASRALGLTPHVTMAGALDSNAVLRAYHSADAFVLPTFAEGIPVVLMEAMAVQLPTISTWVNGIPELIEHDVNGLLIPPADVHALARSVQRVIDDTALGQRLGQAARRTVAERYNLSRNVALLSSVLQDRVP